ncbi:MAG: helix-turn-helix transcriptional regulator [Bacteroidales bacterium]|nr:helix-turn-helix transcriptional regulator [Bacteroidales bacterium]
MNIQRNIEEIRKKKGLKQSIVAKNLGIRQSAYSNYITRNCDIKFSKLEKIAAAIDEPIINIITYPDVYVKQSETKEDCADCLHKDKTIQHLNQYIEVLEKQIKKS